jgi:cobalt/nickel transport protein
MKTTPRRSSSPPLRSSTEQRRGDPGKAWRASTKVVAAVLLLLALVLAGVVSRFASGDPDGLTKVSEDHGFANDGKMHRSVLGGYGGATGVLGVLVVLGLAGGVTYAVRRREHDEDHDESRAQ